MATNDFLVIGGVVVLGGVFGLVLVPIYCWLSLFFSIPICIVEFNLAFYLAN